MQKGNFEMLGNNFSVFSVRDGIIFPDMFHTLKRNLDTRHFYPFPSQANHLQDNASFFHLPFRGRSFYGVCVSGVGGFPSRNEAMACCRSSLRCSKGSFSFNTRFAACPFVIRATVSSDELSDATYSEAELSSDEELRSSDSEEKPPKRRRRTAAGTTTKTTRSKRTTGKALSRASKSKQQEELGNRETEDEEEEEDWPPLVCCFGEAINDFVPSVRVSYKQEHPDMYSRWKLMQWRPPEFARAPSGPSYNVAIALARLGGRVAFIGKVGDDEFGRELVLTLNQNNVQTRGVRFDPNCRTGVSQMNTSYDNNGQVKMSCAQPSAENSLLETEVNLDILKEAKMLHFTSSVLMAEPIRTSLFRALGLSKLHGGIIFFDVNLPLTLWMSREHTWEIIQEAWLQANVIEVTKHELEFLVGEENCKHDHPQYAARSRRELNSRRDEYHYTRKQIAPIWHENLKMLLVTDGTYVIHYYTPEFDGEVLGVEDVIVAAYTCDRTGSGDAVVAGMIRKLSSQPALYHDQETLTKAFRFAICAGIIAQWTIGSTRGLPTESAAQNLLEQIYRPIYVQPLKK